MRQMNVLGVDVKDYGLRESMRMVDSFLKDGKVSTIAYVTKRGLIAAENSDEQKEFISQLDMTVLADSDILRAAGMENRNRIREIDHDEFMMEFLKKMAKGHKTVFLLAGTREQLSTLEAELDSYDYSLNVIGRYSIDELAQDDDYLINDINMKAVDVIISNISSPLREEFYNTNAMKLNAKIWLMLKDEVVHPNRKRRIFRRFYMMVMNSIFKRKVSHYQTLEQEENSEI